MSYLGHRIFVVACGLFVVVHGILSNCGALVPKQVGSITVVPGCTCSLACVILAP